MDGECTMSILRPRNLLRSRAKWADEIEGSSGEEDMRGLSSEDTMPIRQLDYTLWGFRGTDPRGTPAFYNSQKEKNQRILSLRGALVSARQDIETFGKGTTSARRKDNISAIIKRIDDALGDIEWTVVNDL